MPPAKLQTRLTGRRACEHDVGNWLERRTATSVGPTPSFPGRDDKVLVCSDLTGGVNYIIRVSPPAMAADSLPAAAAVIIGQSIISPVDISVTKYGGWTPGCPSIDP
jgi:hypothetical protein